MSALCTLELYRDSGCKEISGGELWVLTGEKKTLLIVPINCNRDTLSY